MREKRFYPWSEFLPDMYERIIPALKPRAKEFAGVWGPPRGGLIMAVILSHNLGIPYFTEPQGPKTLIVDDIADSGETLWPFRKCPIVTCFYRKGSIVVPMLYLYVKEDGEWVVFPWEDAEEKSPG
ncbi:MAG: phosphoribosyltransferase [Candidatus Sungiibacteriota bacterium]